MKGVCSSVNGSASTSYPRIFQILCVNICPAKALELKEEADKTRHVVCDYKKCIRCYCCHEMCPVDAITVHNRENTEK